MMFAVCGHLPSAGDDFLFNECRNYLNLQGKKRFISAIFTLHFHKVPVRETADG